MADRKVKGALRYLQRQKLMYHQNNAETEIGKKVRKSQKRKCVHNNEYFKTQILQFLKENQELCIDNFFRTSIMHDLIHSATLFSPAHTEKI